MFTERLESMSPAGYLRLFRQEDGDIIIQVVEGDPSGGIQSIASVEFCTPFAGGGGSRRTWAALVQLAAAMAEDNLDASQAGRRPQNLSETDQKALAEWGKQCRQIEAEARQGRR